MELPSHPETDDTGRGQEPATNLSWRSVLVIAVVAAVFVAIVVLHLTGAVGPGAH